VLLTTETFIERHADEIRSIIAALHESCAFCDAKENRSEVAHILAESGYFRGNEAILNRSLVGPLDLGTEKSVEVSHFHIFQRREANEPTSERGHWLIDEFIAHGLLTPAQRPEAAAAMRACWTSSALPLPKAPAAAPKPKKRPPLALA
jgi:ABC-type nitrate/sulfonate/bicarbonate transport system substrate-binding protein